MEEEEEVIEEKEEKKKCDWVTGKNKNHVLDGESQVLNIVRIIFMLKIILINKKLIVNIVQTVEKLYMLKKDMKYVNFLEIEVLNQEIKRKSLIKINQIVPNVVLPL